MTKPAQIDREGRRIARGFAKGLAGRPDDGRPREERILAAVRDLPALDADDGQETHQTPTNAGHGEN